MDEKDWHIIKTLFEEKNISKSAQRLYISQPALTYRIKQIEKEFGVNIVIRNKKGIIFTTQGEYIVNYALNMLINLRETKNTVLNLAENVQGTLRLGASSNFAHYKLAPLLKIFRDQYPEIQINVTTGLSHEIMELLRKDDIQIGIIRGENKWNDKKFLLDEDFIYLVSRDEVDLEQLPNLPRIEYNTSYYLKEGVDNWWIDKFNQPPNITMHVDKVETCKEMVKHGLGYAIIPGICLQSNDELFTKKLSLNNSYLTRETWLIYQQSLTKFSIIEAFINFLREVRAEQLDK